MITRDLNVVEVEGALQGAVIDMSIDEAAAHLIMERLIRLYTDPILAFIREMSTNAFDATVAAYEDDDDLRQMVLNGDADLPIHVTLPARLAPMFIVRDQGVGMNFEDIVNVYSKYGASTKRESNDYNGALGFGCKAPLAYTPSFTVQSVKDGFRTTLQVGRTPKGGGAMTVVEGDPGNLCPTTEPNGTTVMIPVKVEDIDQVERTAREFFLDWKPGTVLVNDERPAHRENFLKLTDTISVIEHDKNLVVMANVAYPVPVYMDTGLQGGYALRVEVPTGDVEFTPSREALEMTPHTRARIDQILVDFQNACAGAIQAKIDQAADKDEAMDAMIYWRAVLPRVARSKDDEYTYRSIKLPAKWEELRQPGMDYPFLKAPIQRSYGVESRHDKAEKIKAVQFRRDVFVLGFPTGSKFTANHKRKLNMWREDVDPRYNADGMVREDRFTANAENYVLCATDKIPIKYRLWIDPKRVVQWEHIRKTYKLPTQSSGTGGSRKKLMGSYDMVWTESGYKGEVMASDLRADKPIYFFDTQDYYGQQGIELLPVLHKEWTVVKLQLNRVAKFQRDFPTAKKLMGATEAAFNVWRPTITPDIIEALSAQDAMRYTSSIIGRLDPAKVDDPDLKRAIRLLKMDLTSVRDRGNVFRRQLGTKANLPTVDWTDPMQNYPLINNRTRLDSSEGEHAYIYLNAAYAAKS